MTEPEGMSGYPIILEWDSEMYAAAKSAADSVGCTIEELIDGCVAIASSTTHAEELRQFLLARQGRAE